MGKHKKKNYTELHLRDHLGMHINPFHMKERWNYGSKPNYVFALKYEAFWEAPVTIQLFLQQQWAAGGSSAFPGQGGVAQDTSLCEIKIFNQLSGLLVEIPAGYCNPPDVKI